LADVLSLSLDRLHFVWAYDRVE